MLAKHRILGQDVLSMLKKISFMPPIAKVYVAAKSKFNELQIMQQRRSYASYFEESDRVLKITRPY